MLPSNAFAFAPFSDQQRRLASWWDPGSSPHWQRDEVVAEGSVRSGKTIAGLTGFTLQTVSQFENQTFIVASKSVGALERNVLGPWRQILRSLGIPFHEKRAEPRAFLIGTNTYYLFGAATEKAADFLQGLTAAGAFLDEVALYPRSFYEQVKARCSIDGAKIWSNCNPGGPFHWLKTDVIDRADEANSLVLHFSMDDNPSLPEAVKDRFRRQFTGLWYKRFILGLWVMAEGIIFDQWDDDLVVPCPGPTALPRSIVSIDHGTANPCTFGLLRWSDTEPVHLAREYWHDSRAAGIQKTDSEYADDLVAWLEGENPERIYVDPSAAGFIQELKRRRLPVKAAVNDVLPGISFMSSLIGKACFLVDPSCKHTIREFASYVWDPKAQERGEDSPIKRNDHAMDRVRYALYSHFGAKKQIRARMV